MHAKSVAMYRRVHTHTRAYIHKRPCSCVYMYIHVYGLMSSPGSLEEKVPEVSEPVVAEVAAHALARAAAEKAFLCLACGACP